MKKVVCLMVVMLVATLAFGEETKEEKGLCPKTKMTTNCLTCHSVPSFKLKEGDIHGWRALPEGVKLYDSWDASITGYYFLTGAVIDAEAVSVKNYFDYLMKHNIKKSVVEIQSGGGGLFSGWRIKGIINEYQEWGGSVTTKILGFGASAAAVIFLAGDIRIASATSELMLHELWTFKFLSLETPSDKEDEARVLRHLQNTMMDWVSTRGKLSKQRLDEEVRKKEYWLNGVDMMEVGFAHSLVRGK